MAMSKAVAHPVPIAVVRTRERPDLQVRHRHALLVDTQRVVAAAGTLGREAGVHVVNAEVDERGAARDDAAARVDEAVGEDGHGLHPELEPLVEVLAVQHAAAHVLRLLCCSYHQPNLYFSSRHRRRGRTA